MCFVNTFMTLRYLGTAGLAPLASYFSFYSKRKVTKRMPPYSFAPKEAFGVPEFSGIAYEPALMRRPGAQG